MVPGSGGGGGGGSSRGAPLPKIPAATTGGCIGVALTVAALLTVPAPGTVVLTTFPASPTDCNSPGHD